MSPHAASWTGSCPPSMPHSPAPGQELGRGLRLGPGEPRRQAGGREARGARLSLSLALPTRCLGQASGEQTPSQWERGTLRDQEVFLGQAGVRTTIQKCCVSLMLCCPLWPSLCACRKYLRDADRQVLAQRAFILTVKVLEDTLSELAEVRCPQPPPLPGGPSPATHTPVPVGRSPGPHLPPQWGRSTAIMSAQTLGKLVVSEDGNTFPRCSHPGLPVAAR